MARQNVGNPKFYIDMPSLWWAKGNIEGVGTSINNLVGQSDYRPNLIGLNPSDYIDETLVYNIGREYRIKLKNGVYLPHKTDDKYFIGFFGHNLEDLGVKFSSIKLYDHDGTIVYENPSGGLSIDEICNWDGGDGFAYNGWSLGQWTGGDSSKFYEIGIKLESDSYLEARTILGSLAFGYVYQMPHSPDLSLSMERDYSGVNEQTTRGGSTLTQINYASPPDWAGVPAWELYDNSIGGLINSGLKEVRNAERGRRKWNLKFSYIDSDDLFSGNENLLTSNPTDIATNTDSGYSDSDFNASGNFLKFFGRDSSFV